MKVDERTNKINNRTSDYMSNPQGSDFTRFMLDSIFNDILCSVSNDSDNNAMRDICSKRIVSYDDNAFMNQNGKKWKYAVPIKVSPLTQQDL